MDFSVFKILVSLVSVQKVVTAHLILKMEGTSFVQLEHLITEQDYTTVPNVRHAYLAIIATRLVFKNLQGFVIVVIFAAGVVQRLVQSPIYHIWNIQLF